MLQFLCRIAFSSTFRLSSRTLKITQILKITPHTACQHSLKETKFRSNVCKNVKVTVLGTLQQSLQIKVGRTTALSGCW